MGLGRLPAILSAFLQDRGSRAGHYLSERAARSFVLLFANLVARPERHHLDDLELSAFLRPQTDAAIPDQPPTAGPIVLAALSKPPRVFAQKQCAIGRDQSVGRGEDRKRDRARFTRADCPQYRQRRAQTNARGRCEIFLAGNGLSLVPVSHRSGEIVISSTASS